MLEGTYLSGNFWKEVVIVSFFIGIPFLWINSMSIQTGEQASWQWYVSIFYLVLGWFYLKFLKNEGSVSILSGLCYMATGTMVVAYFTWNHLFIEFLNSTEFRGDIFRDSFNTPRAPFYTFIHEKINTNCETLSFFTWPLVFLIFLTMRIKIGKTVSPFITAIYLFIAILTYAATDGIGDRLLDNNVHFKVFDMAAINFTDVSDVMRNYVDKIQEVRRVDHYPPGNVLVFKLEQMYLPLLGKSLTILCTVFSIYPMRLFLKSFGLSKSEVNLSIILYAILPTTAAFATISLSPITIPFAIYLLYFFRQFQKKQRMVYAIYFGLVASLFLFFSYTISLAFIYLGIISIYGMIKKELPLKGLLQFSISAALIILFIYAFIFYSTGFNQWDCFMGSLRNNTEFMSDGFDNPIRYLYRSTGNLIAYLGGIGLIVLSLSIYAIQYVLNSKRYGQLGTFLIPLIIAVPVCSFSGLFFLETARIWIFFNPFFCIMAGLTLNKFLTEGHKYYVLLLLTITLSISILEEVVLDHSFGYFSYIY